MRIGAIEAQWRASQPPGATAVRVADLAQLRRSRRGADRSARAGVVVALLGSVLALPACTRAAAAPVARQETPSTELRPASRAAEIHYELTHDSGRAWWRVRMRATGIDPGAGDVRLVLKDWGEWTEVDAYYLRELQVHPPVHWDARAPSSFELEPPPDWDGTLEATYAIPLARSGSRAQQSHPLLPRHDDSDAAGFSSNTLADLLQGMQPLAALRTIRLVADPDATIATGWGGSSTGVQEVRLDHPIDNVPLLFGRATGLAILEADGLRYQLAQFGQGRDVTADALRITRALMPLYGRNSGRPYDEPVRLFLTPLTSGGTHTDHGCVVGYDESDPESPLPPDLTRIIAHELFHNWLGGFLEPPDDESLVWFHEGFTEYFTTWHLAASALAEPEWFAERVVAADARARSSNAFGRVAFGDSDVHWRDGNGPQERLGYQGGAALAFPADVELRRQGRSGLMQLVADLLRQGGPLTLSAIRAWMESNGLAEFYASHVAVPSALPEPGPALQEIGFEAEEREASLTYLGIAVGDGEAADVVLAIDPDGPAARAGVEVGDKIVGCSPGRMNPPHVGPLVTTSYRFGLERLASGAGVGQLDVVRRGKALSLSIEPRLIPGGVRVGYRRGGGAIDRFFRFELRPTAR